jgi:phosphopantetheinyl transferase
MISANKQDTIELYFSEFSKHDALESWMDLPSHERTRAAQYRQEEDQTAFTIVRSVLRRILSEKTGIPIQEISFVQNSKGKLSCQQAPTYHFSIAHTKEVFVLAFSLSGPIGVDIEWMHRSLAFEKLEQLVFTEKERLVFQSISSNVDRQRMFLQTWTQKEALTKCLGTTLEKGMQSFEIELDAGRFLAKSLFDNSISHSLITKEIKSYVISVCSTTLNEIDLQVNNLEFYHSSPLFI